MKGKRTKRCIFIIKFISLFMFIAFIVTCSFLLFLNSMNLSEEQIKDRAVVTFLNVVFLTVIFSVFIEIRRKISVDRPVKRIIDATEKITKGDFDVKIEPIYFEGSYNEFDTVISAINKMTEELTSVETLRSDFIANVSHELKTPLAVIQNYATILCQPEISDEKRIEYAKAISETSHGLADLISNILKLNRLENQQIFPEITEFNLGEHLSACLLTFEEMWEKKNLNIETNIGEDITIDADPEMLSIVWNNLFSNAIKFTQNNGKITVLLTEKDGYAIVSIADTGCGMSSEVGKHIFEKFYQGDKSHASEGNGLGLALVKRVIDITKGEISVESTPNKGSRFTVKLRRRNDEMV